MCSCREGFIPHKQRNLSKHCIMCTHKKKIYNHYIQQFVYVNCGFCPACLQEKANRRTNRIRNHGNKSGIIPLFVTLTYDNRYIPYIRKSEIQLRKSDSGHGAFCAPLTVYRDFDRRRVRVSGNYHPARQSGISLLAARSSIPSNNNIESSSSSCDYVMDFKDVALGKLDTKSLAFRSENEMERFFHGLAFDSEKLPMLRGQSDKDKVGVCYFKDFQNFIKRLRINYERKFNKPADFTYYGCSEYGETTRRPHFHALIFVNESEKDTWIDFIYQSWPYTGTNKKRVDVQIARNAASYVSAYVNCGSDFPRFLRTFFRPKCSYSQHFGCDNPAFSPAYILDALDKGSLTYPSTRVLDGQTVVTDLPIPHYLLHRYFPKCKGYSLLSDDEIFRICLSSHALQQIATKANLEREEVRKYATRLTNSFRRFREGLVTSLTTVELGQKFTIFDYARIHSRVWNLFKSEVLKHSYDGLDGLNSSWYYYDNIEDVYDGEVTNLFLGTPPNHIIKDSNYFPVNIARTANLSALYEKKKKTAKINNVVMNSMQYDV